MTGSRQRLVEIWVPPLPNLKVSFSEVEWTSD
jgi:hypothetical protein